MIQIAYQPAYDPFHSIFRLIRLAEHFALAPLQIGQARIADFYLTFPEYLKDARLSRSLRAKLTKLGQSSIDLYAERPAAITVFRKMRTIQDAALQTLVRKGVVDHREFQKEVVQFRGTMLPSALLARARTRNEADEELLEFLSSLLSEFPLEGADGLKHRTGLMEHRYDAV